MEIKPGKYRHFKGNLYEVIGVAGTRRPRKKWWSTVPCTGSTDCGCARLPCGRKPLTGTATMGRDFSLSENEQALAAKRGEGFSACQRTLFLFRNSR